LILQAFVMIHKLSKYLKEWLDFSVEPPPLPVAQFEVGSAVALDDTDGIELLDAFLEHTAGQTTSAICLEVDD